MNKKSTFSIISFILCTVFFFTSFGYIDVRADEIYDCSFPVTYGQTEARSMLQLINNLRQTAPDAIYKNDLIYDYDLEKVAMQRAAELAILVDDVRPDGNSYTQTLADFGFNTGRRGAIYGENVAYGTLDSMDMQATFEYWRDDPGCRNNLLSGFSYVGIGHIKIDNIDYWAVLFSTDIKNTTAYPANDSDAIVTVKIRSSIVGPVRIDYESGANTVQAGESVSAPRYIPSVEFYNRDPDEELVLAPLEFNSNDGYVAAYSGLIAGVKEGNGTISATLFGQTYSYGITVTPGNGNVVNIPTQPITQTPTQAVTPAPTQTITPTGEPIAIVLLPTQGPNDTTPEPTSVITTAPTQTPTQVVTQSPTQQVTEIPTQKVTPSPTQQITPAPTHSLDKETTGLKKGDTFVEDGLKYKVLSKSTVEVLGFSESNKNTELTIPATVKNSGTKFSVVKVANGAFSKNKKLTTVVIEKNVTTIGKKAFYGCKNLKNITINSSKLKKIGKKAFGSIYSKAIIIVPESVKSKYEKLIKKSKIGSKIKINKNK